MNNEEIQQEIMNLKNKINYLENHLNYQPKLPVTNILSDNFLKRAFAILGHYTVASLIIVIPLYIIIFIIAFALYL